MQQYIIFSCYISEIESIKAIILNSTWRTTGMLIFWKIFFKVLLPLLSLVLLMPKKQLLATLPAKKKKKYNSISASTVFPMQIECKEPASSLTAICFSSSNLASIVIYINAIRTLKISGNVTWGWERRVFSLRTRRWGDLIADFLNYFFIHKDIPNHLYYLLLVFSES